MAECRSQNPDAADAFSTCVRLLSHPSEHRDALDRRWRTPVPAEMVLDEISRHVLDEQALRVARQKITDLEKQVRALTEENHILRNTWDFPRRPPKPDPTTLRLQKAVETLTAQVIALQAKLKRIRKEAKA